MNYRFIGYNLGGFDHHLLILLWTIRCLILLTISHWFCCAYCWFCWGWRWSRRRVFWDAVGLGLVNSSADTSIRNRYGRSIFVDVIVHWRKVCLSCLSCHTYVLPQFVDVQALLTTSIFLLFFDTLNCFSSFFCFTFPSACASACWRASSALCSASKWAW